jgi:hypothetical protein
MKFNRNVDDKYYNKNIITNSKNIIKLLSEEYTNISLGIDEIIKFLGNYRRYRR